MKNNSAYNSGNYGLGCACQDQPQGLNGFWSELGAWAWRKVKNNVSMLGVVGAAISQAMDVIDGDCSGRFSTWLQANGGCGRTNTVVRDYTLTDAELVAVENWASNYFSPFYDKVIADCNTIFDGQKPLDQQLLIVNAAITKMTLFLEYIKTNPFNFTANANKEQIIGAQEFFAYADKVIQDIIFESDVLLDTASVKVSSTGLDFKPFILPSISAYADTWKVSNGGIIPQNNTLQPTAAQVQAATTAVATVTDPSTTDGKSGSGVGVVLCVGAVIGIGYLLTKKTSK